LLFPYRNNRPLNRAVPDAWRPCRRNRSACDSQSALGVPSIEAKQKPRRVAWAGS
jgi:hypothetical protein